MIQCNELTKHARKLCCSFRLGRVVARKRLSSFLTSLLFITCRHVVFFFFILNWRSSESAQLFRRFFLELDRCHVLEDLISGDVISSSNSPYLRIFFISGDDVLRRPGATALFIHLSLSWRHVQNTFHYQNYVLNDLIPVLHFLFLLRTCWGFGHLLLLHHHY